MDKKIIEENFENSKFSRKNFAAISFGNVKNTKFLIGIVILGIIVAGFFVNKQMTGNVITGSVIGDSVSGDSQIIEADIVKIQLSQISTKAEWHEYESNGVNVKYFTVKDDKGNVKTAFDACDVCYRSKKGYRQQGKDMVCNNCGNHYAISGLGTKNLKGGGCWPGHLAGRVEGDYFVIEKSDLEAGEYRFR